MCKLLYLLFYNRKLYTKVEWEYIYIYKYISTDGNKKSNTNIIINAMLYILIW